VEILRGDASRQLLPPIPLDPDQPTPLTESTRNANIAVLDVGALTNHYLPYSNMVRCTAIDLNPCHPTVTKMVNQSINRILLTPCACIGFL
jgi:hypothetical protein